MRNKRVGTFLIILTSVFLGNSNTNGETKKLDKNAEPRNELRALNPMAVADEQAKIEREEEKIEVLPDLFNDRKESPHFGLRNLLMKQKRSTLKQRRKRGKTVQQNKTEKKRRNGFQDYSRERRSVDDERDICNRDSRINLYTSLKRFPKPLEFERIILNDAHSQKALCLDGTPAVYYLRKARDQDKRWMLFFPGGAWCSSKESCFARSQTYLGSSKFYPSMLGKPAGILSSNRSNNPYFYDLNVLYLQYCDGSSFMGDLEKPLVYRNRYLYSRGFTILNAFLDEIIPKYLSKARDVVIVGISAGGLGVMANADLISSRIPKAIKVHFVSDGGLFVDVPCRNKQHVFSRWMRNLHNFHNITRALLLECVASFNKGQEWRCLMPENVLRFTNSSIAIVNSMTDAWQLVNLKGARCGYVARYCTSYELGLATQLRNSVRKALHPITSTKKHSFFLYTCIRHCMLHLNKPWRVLNVGSVTVEDFIYRFVGGEKNVQLMEDPGDNPVCTL